MSRISWIVVSLGVLLVCSLGQADVVTLTLGDMDGGLNNGPGSADDVYADLDWQIAVFATAPPSWPMVGFDFPRKESQVCFTFEYEVYADLVISAATLTLSIRGVDGKVSNDQVLLDDVTNAYGYELLGWNPVSLSVVSERTIDLADVDGDVLIPLLQDGQFNVSVRDDTLVDYARLELTISAAPTSDLNEDGFVGLDDLDIVLGHWNQNVTPYDALAGDISGDGFVGLEDLDLVLINWNAGTPPGVVAVPEPGVLGMVLCGGLVGVSRRGKHRA